MSYNKRMKAVLPVVVAIIASLAACGGGSSATHAPFPCPLGPIPAPPQLAYPAPNATKVPDGNFSLRINDPYSHISLWSQPDLVPGSGGPSVTAGPYEVVPTPGANVYTSAVPSLRSATTYSVNVTSPASGGPCAATQVLGSFTTQ